LAVVVELARRDGEIEKPVATCAAFFVQLVEPLRECAVALFLAEFTAVIENAIAEAVPDLVLYAGAGKLPGGFLELRAERAEDGTDRALQRLQRDVVAKLREVVDTVGNRVEQWLQQAPGASSAARVRVRWSRAAFVAL